MRIVFMGTPAFAVPTLDMLIKNAHDIVLCVTQPAKPSGRGLRTQESPVSLVAKQSGIPVISPFDVNTHNVQSRLQDLRPDMIVVVAYGNLLKKNIRNIPTYACINAHASLLPRWRGAAPIQHAIMANDPQTGVTIMRMHKGCDTGDIIKQHTINLDPKMNAGQLHDTLSQLSATLMCDVLDKWVTSNIHFMPQNSKFKTHAKKITSHDRPINFHRNASQVDAQIRGLSPRPGAYFLMSIRQKKQQINILKSRVISQQELIKHHHNITELNPNQSFHIINEAFWLRCAEGAIQPELLRLQGKNTITITDFINGYRDDILAYI